MNIERDPKSILKARLASGEIDKSEYLELLSLLRDGQTQRSATTTRASIETKQLLAQVDNILLFEDCVAVDGEEFRVSDIVSVSGASSSQSINFIPMDKRSYVGFTFLSGKSVSLSEERTVFAPARHSAIRNFYAALKKLTFHSRLTQLVARLVSEGRLKVFHPFSGEGEPVFLTSQGVLETSAAQVDLKRAKQNGTFGIGVESRALGYSRSFDVDEVVASEAKGTLGLLPRRALRFKVNMLDTDVVNALLSWLAEPGNRLG